ncbi:hypothetical protein DH2020_001545 [Rehmannia glutinosa]|uniref:Uncharacterized protein n=1 Tax=Rehmannia glutinosa TaxID=99300 RepID=A0ABR0Y003_REHGL
MAQNGYDGLEHEVLQWLEDEQTKVCISLFQEQFGVGRVQVARRHGMKSPSSAFQRQWKCSHRPQRTRNQTKWASSGPGMQAVFLGSNQKSCGTGVFIPRTEGMDHKFSKKPAFSPVLLPSRVIQTLNLNVHELGREIKPQSGNLYNCI